MGGAACGAGGAPARAANGLFCPRCSGGSSPRNKGEDDGLEAMGAALGRVGREPDGEEQESA